MNEKDTILQSGMIEAYCLGTLSESEATALLVAASEHPELRHAIDQTMATLQQYPAGPSPRHELKNKVLNFLDNFLPAEIINLVHPPLIHLHSDADAWNKALAGVQPEMEEDGMAARVLNETEEVVLSVVWLSGEMVEDKHEANEFLESFFILEGACECDFEGKIVRFSAGDYFDIPPNTRHTIKNISPSLGYVKGLVQRRKAA
ncbi:MAG: cupin domain-containing protein [Saprospiraceae bacterium]|nr:cupin domain-containing protein [Saprospiraceae bacterium]